MPAQRPAPANSRDCCDLQTFLTDHDRHYDHDYDYDYCHGHVEYVDAATPLPNEPYLFRNFAIDERRMASVQYPFVDDFLSCCQQNSPCASASSCSGKRKR